MTGPTPTPGEPPRALAEPSGLVEVYRRVLSPQTRRAIATKVSPRARHQLKQWVARAARDGNLSERRGERLARRQPELLAGADRLVVTADRGPRVARIGAAVTPAAGPVGESADGDGGARRGRRTPFPGAGGSPTAPRWWLSTPTHRAQACAALAAACGRVPGYVSVPGSTGQPAAGFEPKTWDRLADAPVLRLTWYWTDPQRRLVLGQEYGCDVEFWTREGDSLVAPRRNPSPKR